MGKYIEWLSKEMQEPITAKRAVYITLCFLSFLLVLIGGGAESIILTLFGLVALIITGRKADIIEWPRKKK